MFLSGHVGYAARLIAFSFRTYPALYLALAVSFASICVELAAMVSLLPLTSIALGSPPPPDGTVARWLAFVSLQPTFTTLLALFVGLLALRVLTFLASQSLATLYGRRLLAQLASHAFDTITKRSSMREIEKQSIGYFVSLAGDESFRASTIVISLMQLFATGTLATFYFIAILAYSPAVAFGVCTVLAISGASLLGALRRSQQLGQLQIEQSRAAGSLFLDALNGLRTVRAFSAEDYVVTNYASRMFRYVHTLFMVDFISLMSRAAPALVLLLGFLIAALMLPKGDAGYTPAAVVTILALLLRFFPVTGQALTVLLRVVADSKAARDVLAVAIAPPAEKTRVATASLGPVESIVLQDVSFAHVPEKPVLRRFGVRLQRGRSYALCGPSGSGKSTIFDLLLRFYDVQSGAISVNGTALDTIALNQLRGRILLVGQHTVIFNDTVENNVRFGREASAAAVRQACRFACLDDFVLSLPQGYQTTLNYQGTNLSGGQRQRIGLARALLRQPDVLLLDEITAGLDHETRDRVVANVLDEYRSRMVLFSTHDLDLAARADEIIALRPLALGESTPPAAVNG
jgi:ABC-type multidrug transport system fused ATPase/permease subunit